MPTKHTAYSVFYDPPLDDPADYNYGWDDGIAHERDRVRRVLRAAFIKDETPALRTIMDEIEKGDF